MLARDDTEIQSRNELTEKYCFSERSSVRRCRCAPWVHSGVESLKPPAFQFYPDDFLGGTLTMTNEECGAYMRLLCLQWCQGFITDRDIKRIATLSDSDGIAMLKGKFECDEHGHYRNARLEAERKKQQEYKETQAKSGKLGAEQRWRRHSDPIATPMAKNGSPSPSPSPSTDATNKQREGQSWPTLKEVTDRGQFIGVSPEECEKFFHHYEAMGWVDKNGNSIHNWQSKLAVWKTSQQEKTFAGRNGNGTDPFWKDKARLDLVEKEIATINARASHTAMEVLIQPQDKERFIALRKERKELKQKMRL